MLKFIVLIGVHCALIMVAGAKAGVIISKPLWKRIGTLYHNVICAIQERFIIIIIITIGSKVMFYSGHGRSASV